MGSRGTCAMKVVACILMAALAYAADVQMIEEMGSDIVYRISWRTEANEDPTTTASKGTFTINIKGDGVETGAQTFVTHPGYACGAASDAKCYPDITGAVLADGDSSALCECDPNKDGYDEEKAKWHAESGMVQKFNLKAADVGEITEVVVEGDASTADGWACEFIKIDTNSMETGNGNGIYYIDVGKKINADKPPEMKTAAAGAVDGADVPITMDNKDSHKYGIIKCEADSCMKKMDKMMMFA